MIVTDASELLGDTGRHALGTGDAVAPSAAVTYQPSVVTDQSAAACRRQFAPGRSTSSRSRVGDVARKEAAAQPVMRAL
jgi:hypothetical protein